MTTTPGTIGAHVYEVLTAAPAVSALVGDRVFPLVTKDPQDLPWVVYTDMSVIYGETKDGAEADSGTLTVLCASATYVDSVALMEAAAAALNGDDGLRVASIRSYYAEETGFVQEINIKADF